MKNFFVIFTLCLLIFTGCDKSKMPNKDHIGDRKLLLYYGAGFNSLSSYLKEDIGELIQNNKIPTLAYNDDILLVFDHLANPLNYTTPKKSYLFRVYKDSKKDIIKDTLLTIDENRSAVEPEIFEQVLNYVVSHFPCDSRGLIFSSHGFGYLPEGYYSKPSKYENTVISSGALLTSRPRDAYKPIPGERLTLEELEKIAAATPDTKTIGQEYLDGGYVSKEMAVDAFAAAFPVKFDYILFDACLMGGVEVAYELRNAASYIGFSQTEILADGLPYDVILDYLFADGKADPEGVCRIYMQRYLEKSYYSCATFSFIRTDKLEALAKVCKGIFEEHREELMAIVPSKIQGFFRDNRHYFYDFEDIVYNLSLTEKEKNDFDIALDDVVLYKDATEYFLEIKIDKQCGLSSFLPSNSGKYLDNFYRTTAWNKATEMLK
ncbi:MAG: hypothetical protein HUJ95_01305 [Bacteroidales bacterium]|nr:hypothetical protein [Bacteroidales bacterium]